MLWDTVLLIAVVGHLSLAGSLIADAARFPVWTASPLALIAAFLFSLTAIGASSFDIITTDGTVVTRSEPALAIYAFALAIVAFVICIAITIAWLPTDDIEVSSSGY